MTISAETIRTVVGIIGNGTALVLFFSPLPTFRRIWKSRSVEQFPAAPYLATLMNCLLWVLYGLPLVHPHSMLVITINGCGLVIELSYVIIYLCFSSRRQRLQVLGMLFIEIAFVAVVAILVITLFHTHGQRSLVVGVLCVIFGTVMYAAPLSVMKEVIKTKSVEFMPFSLSLASFINGACWTAYALIRFDLFITIPNGLGVAFAVAQLILHVIYHKSTVRQMEERKKLENGLAKPNGNHEAADLELGTKTNGVKNGSS